jgi:uncharacterized membrane protein YdjX (TVP38/TMEM64 family)
MAVKVRQRGAEVKLKKKTVLKILIILLTIGFLLWFNNEYIQTTPVEIRNWILSFGWFAPFLFMIIYTLRPLILFPASILSLAGGLAFGAAFGTIFTVIGATAGAVLSFIIARKLGKNVAKKEWTGKSATVQRQLEEKGFFYVVLLRFIPILNFDMISYLAGISKVKLRAFFFGTLFGIIPGTFAYNFLGASIVDGDWVTVLLAIAIFLLVMFIPILTSKRLKQKLGISVKT